MQECEQACNVEGIPPHLHKRGRSSESIGDGDRLFLHHDAIDVGAPYGFDIKGVRYLDQSANSEMLNPDGSPCDVLYDTRNGGILANKQVACLPVAELRMLAFPNPNLVKKGAPSPPAEAMHSFEVFHDPMPCMFPHCEIALFQNEQRKRSLNSSEVKSIIRRQFARVAEKYRSDMLMLMRSEGFLE